MSEINFGADSLGCILDGVFGQASNDVALVDLAQEAGMDLVMGGDGPDGAIPSWSDLTQSEKAEYAFLSELADESLEWLNENACEDGYTLEWVDGGLFLSGPVRESVYAEVTVDGEIGHVERDYDRLQVMGIGSVESVRIALPGEDGPDTPTQFDWLNSLCVDFHADDTGQEEVWISVSTGDPRGGFCVATLCRLADGSVTLHLPNSEDILRHENYAKSVPSTVRDIWKLR